jgi:hypothetical protein
MSAADADAAEAAAEPAWSADDAEAEAALLVGALEAETVAEPSPVVPPAKAAKQTSERATPAPVEVAIAAKAVPPTPAPDPSADLKSTQIIVSGLVSVASVASFRRALGRLPGVSAVTVTSGPDGEFLFHASHRRDADFQATLPALPGFVSEITGMTDGAISLKTLDPESEP